MFCLSAFAQSELLPCSGVVVTGPNFTLQTGEVMTFTASIFSEVKYKDLKYIWAVDKGKIIKGQNTNTIQVSTEGLSDTTITAAVEIELLNQQCESIDSETGVIAPKIEKEWVDYYYRLSLSDELARIDSFLVGLNNNPNYEGYILITTGKNESFTDIKKHIRKLIKHIKFRKISPSRITFAIAKSEDRSTRLFNMFREEKPPKCEDYEIIKGSDS